MIYVSDNRVTEESSKRTMESALNERQARQIESLLQLATPEESDLTWVLKAWEVNKSGEVTGQLFLHSWLEKGKFRTLCLTFNPSWERRYDKQKA